MTYSDDGADSDATNYVTLSGGPGQDHHHHTISMDVGNKVSALLSPIMSSAGGGGGGKIKSSSRPPTTSFFKFLKDAALLAARNRGLFAAVLALTVASNWLLLLVDYLTVGVEPRLEKQVLADAAALVAPRSNVSAAAASLVGDDVVARQLHHRGLVRDAWGLAWAHAANLLLGAAASSAVWTVVALFAAVAAYSRADTAAATARSFRSVLGKAVAKVLGPALTLAYVYALELAYEAALMTGDAFLASLYASRYPTWVLLPVALLLLAADTVFFLYFSFLCAFSVVVAVFEPGRRGPGAVARAWRLLRGRTWRVALFVAVVGALEAAASGVHDLVGSFAADTGLPAGWLLQGFLYDVLEAALSLFVACANMAFYYECKESSDAATTTEFVKLASEQLIVDA